MQLLHYPQDLDILNEKVFYYNKDDDIPNVHEIIQLVRKHRDQALVECTQKFDQVTLTSEELQIDLTNTVIDEGSLHPDFKRACKEAIKNITAFHRLQLPKNLEYRGEYEEILEQRFTPMDSAGVYVPGGRGGETPLVSSLLMNVIPAQLAGVGRIVVVSPPTVDKTLNPHVLYTLRELGISEVFLSGGAHAIAALTYGTESIRPVDIIVGPGNRYVNTAKKIVFGEVMIDGLFGHSEIVIVADRQANPEWVAADLLSQAEHAGGELVVLVSDHEPYAREVMEKVVELTAKLERKEMIRSSLNQRGLAVVVDSFDGVEKLIDHIAPEHLELLLPDADSLAKKIRHVGAIFIGEHASEPIGDYICGTNHVLPTNRSARFSSPLGVYTFLKRTNVIRYNEKAFTAYASAAATLAEVEGLTAHKNALTIRQRGNSIVH